MINNEINGALQVITEKWCLERGVAEGFMEALKLVLFFEE